MQGNLDRLPKWAKDEILRLEANVEHWQAKASVGPDDTNVFVDPYSDAPKPLHRRAHVRWTFDENVRRCRYVEVWQKGGELQIQASSDTIAFVPQASNCGRIRLVNWR